MNHLVASQPNAGEPIAAFVRAEGSATAPWLLALLGSDDPRDATDAVHALCMLYGGHPNLIEAASTRSDDAVLHGWLSDAADAFTAERQYLAAVVAAAGPLPSTRNHAQTEAALAHQRHALETLARSDRAGCAIGAATALVLDWQAIGPLLDRVAGRVGISVPDRRPPDRTPCDEAPIGPAHPGLERARVFGARQLLAQQRSLWLLLEARAAARER